MTIDPRARWAIKTILVLFSCSRLVLFSGDVSAAASASGVELKPVFSDALSNQVFLADLNTDRQANGEVPLRLNAQLDQAAEAKVEDMINNNYWDHFRPSDHKAPWDFIDESGYAYKVAGENLAKGFRTEGGITQAWMNSPEHRANMLSANYQDVGFATAFDYQPDGSRVLLTVEMFGAR